MRRSIELRDELGGRLLSMLYMESNPDLPIQYTQGAVVAKSPMQHSHE